MGMVLEHQGNEEKALRFYHASLRYALHYQHSKNNEGQCEKSSSLSLSINGDGTADEKNDDGVGHVGGSRRKRSVSGGAGAPAEDDRNWLDDIENGVNNIDGPFSLMEVRVARSTRAGRSSGTAMAARDGEDRVAEEDGEMELFLERRFDQWTLSSGGGATTDARVADNGDGGSTRFYYDELFPPPPPPPPPPVGGGERPERRKPGGGGGGGDGSDMDIAMTLHQIGQIHRRSDRHAAALSAYNASLRGMRGILGSQHGVVAAVLGNIGNLHVETGDYDMAFAIYQEVLGIETLQLGLSHPEVAVTLHNIATIECSRGNYADGVSLYRQVVDMQRIRYGNEHIAVAVTLSCLADAYEKLRSVNRAVEAYEEALNCRIAVLGKSHLDVGRLMHKLGRLALDREDYAAADIYTTRASEIYEINKLGPDHVFVCEMARDCADIRAQLALAKK
jgi:tetratricopeptide (TPR) repeat protein